MKFGLANLPDFVALDLETSSRLNLREVGISRYAENSSIHIAALVGKDGHCVATCAKDCDELIAALVQSGAVIIAHNAQFEKACIDSWCLRNNMKAPPIERYRCTMAYAHSSNMPASLDGLSTFLFRDFRKDDEGKKVMLEWTRRIAEGYDPECEPYVLERLGKYCLRDSELCWKIWETQLAAREAEAGKETPWRYWFASCRINEKGLPVDAAEVERVACLVHEAKDELRSRLAESMRCQPTPSKFKAFINSYLKPHGQSLKTTDKTSIWAALSAFYSVGNSTDYGRLEADAAAFIALNGRATDKWDSAICKMTGEGDAARLKQSYTFRGAFTGRFKSGGKEKGIQAHNYKRVPEKQLTTQELMLQDHPSIAQLCDFLEKAGKNSRSMVTAPKGKTFFQADYKQIEMRIAFWLAGETEALEKLAAGIDLYKDLAAKIYGKGADEVSDDERLVAKQALLGLQYGMGVKRFYAGLVANGIPDAKLHATTAHTVYHQVYGRIKQMHKLAERAMSGMGDGAWTGDIGAVNLKKAGGGKYAILALPTDSNRLYWYPENRHGDYIYTSYETGKPIKEKVYGGQMFEHMCSGIAADILVHLLADLPTVATGHTHDSVLIEVPENSTSTDMQPYVDLMEKCCADKLEGLPLAVEWKLAKQWK